MDIAPEQELVKWIVGLVLSNLLAIGLGIINIVKAGKMMPKEVQGAELNNKGKDLDNRDREISIADKYEDFATKAVEKALKMQERMTSLEEIVSKLTVKLNEQEGIIKEQTQTIREQNDRLDAQETKIKEQDEEISLLKCELDVAQKYNQTLIEQMKQAKIIPAEKPVVTSKKVCKDPTVLK